MTSITEGRGITSTMRASLLFGFLAMAVNECFELTPKGIIDTLDLLQPIYKQTAAYGHFGRNDIDLPWEQTNKVDDLRALINN